MNLLDKADVFPPFVCRILANHYGHPLTVPELVKRCGWCTRKVIYISAKTSWKDIPVGDMVTFTKACDVDIVRQGAATERLKLMIAHRFPRLKPRALAVLLRKLQALPPEHPARRAWGKS